MFASILIQLVALTFPFLAASSSTEMAALVALYQATDGPHWNCTYAYASMQSALWDVTNTSSNYCGWYGVYCYDSQVTRIDLGYCGLSGTLPAGELCASLLSLESLYLSFNTLQGSLPVALAQCSALEDLELDGNNITGTIPPEFSQLLSMADFDVSFNHIVGTVPATFGAWTQLESFAISNNNISGSLSPLFESWTALRYLYTYNNNMTGTLSPNFGVWRSLRTFKVHSNRFSGSLPSEYASWVFIDVFSVSGNQLIGTLPPQYASWGTSIQYFYVYNNSLSGSLPGDYSKWSSIVEVNANINSFTGTLPAMYSLWSSVTLLYIASTQISGTIPDSWGDMQSLFSLQLYLNSLSGTLPNSFAKLGNLVAINVAFNNLSGTLPVAAWAQRQKVQSIIVQDNPYLHGYIPSSWNSLFASRGGYFAMVSICRTQICGAALPALLLGYGCLASNYLPLLANVDYSTLANLAEGTTWTPSIACGAGKHNITIVKTTPSHTEDFRDDDNQPIASSSSSTVTATSTTLIAAGVGIQQLLTPAASAGALHALQGALVIRRLRDACQQQQASSSDGSAAASCCDSATSPTQLLVSVSGSRGDDSYAQFTGAVIGNAAIVLGFGGARILFRLGVRAILEMAQKKGDSFRQSFTFTFANSISELVDCTNVALIWPAYTFLLPPTAAVGVTLVSVHVDSASVVIGVVGVLLALAPWLVAVRGIWRRGGACEAQPSFTLKNSKHEGRSAFVALKEFLLEPSEQLYFEKRSQRCEALRSYGPVFAAFRATRMYYVNIELLFSFATGVLLGVAFSLPNACDATIVGWLLVASSVLECGCVLILRPYSALVDMLTLLVVTTLSVASQITSLLTTSDTGAVASSAIGLVASAFQLIVAIFVGLDGVVRSTQGDGLYRGVTEEDPKKRCETAPGIVLLKSSLRSGSSANREISKRRSDNIIGSGLSTRLMHKSAKNSLSTLRLDVRTAPTTSMGLFASMESSSPRTLPKDPTIAANLSAMIGAICNTQLALLSPPDVCT